MKTCSICKIDKPFSEYGKRAALKDGHRSACKECESKKNNGNPDVLAQKKKYRDNNKEKVSKYRKERYQRDKDKEKLYKKDYRATEKGRVGHVKNEQKRRKAVRNTDDGTITTEGLLELFDAQNNKCYHCGDELDRDTPNAVHLDHLVPLVKGGQHTMSNVRWSCAYCNLSKGGSLTS